jgi:methyl-accepting chemotaxis protein
MDFLAYLWPDNAFSRSLVGVLAVVFSAWLAYLARRSWFLLTAKRLLHQMEDVESLRNFVREKAERTASGFDAASAFDDYLEGKPLSRTHPLRLHLRSIFLSGAEGTQLDVHQLVRHTSNELFGHNMFLRTLLGSFIVIGLLGTLFGLADSLGGLARVLPDYGSARNEGISLALERLLGNLKSAFAPSIWGVGLTVFGVIVYGFFLRIVCTPLQGVLERVTLGVWVPRLIPTTPSRLLEALQRSEEHLRSGFAAAEKVGTFAADVKEQAEQFNNTLRGTNKNLKLLSDTAANLALFSQRFQESVERLGPFQEDLRRAYARFEENTGKFHQAVETIVGNAAGIFNNVASLSSEQTKRLDQVLEALRLYEQSYIESRREIDNTLVRLIGTAHQAVEQLGTRNEEIRQTVAIPIGKSLADIEATLSMRLAALDRTMVDGLGGVAGTLTGSLERVHGQVTSGLDGTASALRTGLDDLVRNLQSFDTPIRHAAESMSGSMVTFVRKLDDSVGRMERNSQSALRSNSEELRKFEEWSRSVDNMVTTVTRKSDELVQAMRGLSEHLAAQQRLRTAGMAPGSVAPPRVLGSGPAGASAPGRRRGFRDLLNWLGWGRRRGG